MASLHIIGSRQWQIGLLPETGGAVAFGRIRYGGTWVDVMRPTDPANYGTWRQTSSYILIPWSNRIRDGKFAFRGETYQLNVNWADGTAIHGDTQHRAWQVVIAEDDYLRLAFNSADVDDMNFPFQFTAEMEYRAYDDTFETTLFLKNTDTRAFPAGMGHHPFFLRAPGGDANLAQLQIPAHKNYVLEEMMPTSGKPVPIVPELDFREMRSLSTVNHLIDDLLTDRDNHQPARILYPAWNVELEMHSDRIFKHYVLYVPQEAERPYFALEPVTNANDGFNLFAQGAHQTGVVVLEPNSAIQGSFRLKVNQR